MADAVTQPVKTPWNAVGALDFAMTQTRNEAYLKAFTPEQLDYFYSFPSWVITAWGIATWGALLASVVLLFRQKRAVLIFLVSLLAMVPTMIHNYVLTDGMKVMGGIGPVIFAVVIFVIGLLLWLYARAMTRRGVLR